MVKPLLFILLMVLWLPDCWSQNTLNLRGYVNDTAGKSLENVNIIVRHGREGKILAYTSTQSDGTFQINIDSSFPIYIQANLLSYKPAEIDFSTINEIPSKIYFTLLPHNVVLKEVIVKAKASASVETNDTISFKANAFRDSTERKLEDLLAKIPGIDVEKSTGKITVMGQEIKKILIEGDDLAGKKYSLLSKNLPADMVDKIQIINRFSENELLNGIAQDYSKVLNITINNDKKQRYFGELAAGMGTDIRKLINANLFRFSPNWKTIFFTGYNNIGISGTIADLQHDNENTFESIVFPGMLKYQQTSPFDNNPYNRFPFGTENFLQNNLWEQSALFSYHRPEKLIVRGILSFSTDKVKSSYSNKIYFSPGINNVNYQENAREIFRSKNMNINFDVKRYITKNSILQWNTSWSCNAVRTIADITINSDDVYSSVRNLRQQFTNSILFTHRINKTNAYELAATLKVNSIAPSIFFKYTQPRIFPFTTSMFNQLSDSIENPALRFSSMLRRINKKNNIVISYGLSANMINEKFSSSPFIKYTLDTWQSSGISNQIDYKQTEAAAFFKTTFKFKNTDLFADLLAGINSFHLNRGSADHKQTQFNLQPSTGLRTSAKRYLATLTYTFRSALPNVYDVLTQPIAVHFRSLNVGDSLVVISNNHTIIGNYSLKSRYEFLTAYINVYASWISKNYQTILLTYPEFDLYQRSINYFPTQNFVLSVAAEPFISALSLRLKIRPGISRNELFQPEVSTNKSRRIIDHTASLYFSMRSSFTNRFNFFTGNTFVYKKLRFYKEHSEEIKQFDNLFFVDFMLDLHKHIYIKFSAENYSFFQKNLQQQGYTFANFSAQYRTEKNKWEILLQARNLLNNKAFVQTSLTQNYTSIASVSLLNRNIFVRATYKF